MKQHNAKVKNRGHIVVFSVIWLIGLALVVGGGSGDSPRSLGVSLMFIASALWCLPLCAWFDGILFDVGAQGSVFGNWRAMGVRWLRDCLCAIIIYHPVMLGICLDGRDGFWTNLAIFAAVTVEIGTVAALLGVPYRFFRNIRRELKKPAPQTPPPTNVYQRAAELAREKRAAQKAVPAQTQTQTQTQTPAQTPAEPAETSSERRALEQQAERAQLAAQLEQQKRAAQTSAEAPKEDAPVSAAPVFRMSREALLPLLNSASQTLTPNGPALGTLAGQRALYEEALAVLPTLAILRHTPPLAAFLYLDEEDPSRLPDHVSRLLGGICGILADADIGVLPTLWLDLPPEALVRGWRALSVYRRISAAQQAFDLPLQTLEDHLREREDAAEWLEDRANGGASDEH